MQAHTCLWRLKSNNISQCRRLILSWQSWGLKKISELSEQVRNRPYIHQLLSPPLSRPTCNQSSPTWPWRLSWWKTYLKYSLISLSSLTFQWLFSPSPDSLIVTVGEVSIASFLSGAEIPRAFRYSSKCSHFSNFQVPRNSSIAIMKKALLMQLLWADQVEHEQTCTKKLLSHQMIMEINKTKYRDVYDLQKILNWQIMLLLISLHVFEKGRERSKFRSKPSSRQRQMRWMFWMYVMTLCKARL